MSKKENIELSKEFIDKIKSLTEKDETFEDCLKRLIKGYEKDFKNISREKEAFSLSFEAMNENNEIIDSEYLIVTYVELADSKIGDIFEAQKIDYTYFINQKAVLIYKDDDSCLVKFIDEIYTKSKKLEEKEIVAYHFI
ncbi:MAG: hypothetical protein KO202_08295 [Methanobacteriaceae archaeon]|jgi:hypothetical protein|nr:hypothetical protein [Methanobacteriaceae archaeon]